MAEDIARGAEAAGAAVTLKAIEEYTLTDFADADGLVVGSPTYFSNVAWPVKKLIDESIVLYRRDHQLQKKVGGCFTSAGTHRDGKDCIRMLELAFGLHHRVKMIPGIIRVSGDSTKKTSAMCQDYGRRIAQEALSQSP
jgi:NAD(P)H dehydrogenase (quinone)